MKKKYAFILMGDAYDPEKHRAVFDTPAGTSIIQTVRNFDEAKSMVLNMKNDGVGAIELCGAFNAAMAGELVAVTDNEVAIGHVVHDPALDDLFLRFFGG